MQSGTKKLWMIVVLLAAGCTQESATTTGDKPGRNVNPTRLAAKPREVYRKPDRKASPASESPDRSAPHSAPPSAPSSATPSASQALPRNVVATGHRTGAPLPQVVMTDGHADLCHVKVGDRMPEIDLPDLEGNPNKLENLFGERLTVVFFWKGDRALARSELVDLGPDVADPFASEGVKVVGIAVEETVERAKQLVGEAKAPFPNLIDADGGAFAQVGTERLPRTYLVDAEGSIVWFDIEYSRSTRRELRKAIRAALPPG